MILLQCIALPTSSFFEILMLLCFAFSWPISIVKALKTKIVIGKSPLFMMIIIAGYTFGIIHKVLNSFNYVTFLYLFNLLLVAADLMLYFHFVKKNKVDLMEQKSFRLN